MKPKIARRTALATTLVVILAAVFAMSATPATAQTDMGVLEVVPGTHNCENFGTTVSGYRAGHCVDLFRYQRNDGSYWILAVGQAFCQRSSDEVIVQCAGISQSSWARGNFLGEWTPEVNVRCGRYTNPWHNPPCPTGRFQHWSAEQPDFCPFSQGKVRTTIALPVSGAIQRSGDLYSNLSDSC